MEMQRSQIGQLTSRKLMKIYCGHLKNNVELRDNQLKRTSTELNLTLI